jgi:hypothetical protein
MVTYNLALRLRTRRAVPPLPHTSSRHGVRLIVIYVFIERYLVKDRDKFTFTFYLNTVTYTFIMLAAESGSLKVATSSTWKLNSVFTCNLHPFVVRTSKLNYRLVVEWVIFTDKTRLASDRCNTFLTWQVFTASRKHSKFRFTTEYLCLCAL